MDASERIVEAYVRAVRGCLTSANVRCDDNKELDLLAVAPDGTRYHIETTVSTSNLFSKITSKVISKEKQKTKKAHYRRTIDFFDKEKFNHPSLAKTLARFGFVEGQYRKVIVTWGATSGALAEAKCHGLEVWYLPDIIRELLETAGHSGYLSGDERIFQLISLYLKSLRVVSPGPLSETPTTRQRHAWSREDNVVALYIALHGAQSVGLPVSQMQEKLGVGALLMRAQQFIAIHTNGARGLKSGLVSPRLRSIYSEYTSWPQQRLLQYVRKILGL